MQKIAITLLVFFVLSQKKCFAQFSKQLDSLCVLCNRTTSDSQKVIALGKLADYYYIFKLERQADSILNQQLLIAELSNNSNLILQALFGDAILNISSTATSESFDKTIKFIQKGIDYAKSTNQYNYIALGYTRMSDILRRRGEYDKALSNSVLALSSLQNVTSDSVKALTYISLGDTYQARGEEVSACTNYNNAYDIAVKIKSVPLQSKIHHCISEMYKSLDDDDLAKDELNKSLTLNKLSGYSEGMMMDYFDLARLTEEPYFISKAIDIADSLRLYKYLINAKRLMLAYYYVVEKNNGKALQYLKNEPDMKQSFLNSGIENYYQTIGNIYLYSNQPDSALFYYQLAVPEFERKFDKQPTQIIFELMAESYTLKNDFSKAIIYYRKALELTDDSKTIAKYSDSLSDLYEKQKDYKHAFFYSKQATTFKDSLRSLSKEKDIALLKVDRENRKHEQELIQQQKTENNKRNLQYMAITVVIIIVFFGMLLIGSFPVSKLTVRLMGYFFFISVFEFIVLLIDNLFLTHVVHNQPLILWLIKIALIGLLVPFQHFLEHNLLGLLESKKLIEVRTKFSLKRWWSSLKKPPSNEEVLEEDTAVL